MTRFSLILIVSMLSAFGLIGSDVYLPTMPAMAVEFQVAAWRMSQTISAYLIVLAVAQLFYGPLSDRWGRKPVLIGGIALYVLGSIGCACTVGFSGFLAWRMVQALGAAAGLVIGRAIIADTCNKQESAKVYSVVYPLVSLSPALAPALGGYLAAWFGWRADFLFVAAFGVFTLLLVLTMLRETRPIDLGANQPFSGISEVLRDRTFVRYTVVVCAIYCSWFVYLTQSPFIFRQLGLSETVSGWLYVPLTVGIIFANIISRNLIERVSYDGIVAAGVGCFIFGALAFLLSHALHLSGAVGIVLPMFFVSLSNGSSLSLCVSGAIASKHGRAATASGLIGFFQIGSASLASYAVSALFGTGIPVLAAAILVFSLLAGAAVIPRWSRAPAPARS